MRYRFLIVDDTQFMRKMAADSLKRFDYEVAGEAVNGKQAIHKYKELKPDIVLMDLTMPEMAGVDAIKNILQFDPKAVILVCSSSNQQEMIEEALEAGAKGYLTKPFKPENMEEAIRKFALPHLAAEQDALAKEEVAVSVEEAPRQAASAAPSEQADSVPASNRLSNFVTSYMCNWEEEIDGQTGQFAVICPGRENKLVIEWTPNGQTKQQIALSMDGFQQLSGWLDQQVFARK